MLPAPTAGEELGGHLSRPSGPAGKVGRQTSTSPCREPRPLVGIMPVDGGRGSASRPSNAPDALDGALGRPGEGRPGW